MRCSDSELLWQTETEQVKNYNIYRNGLSSPPGYLCKTICSDVDLPFIHLDSNHIVKLMQVKFYGSTMIYYIFIH